MKDAGLDIEQALRRRLNWGKGAETKSQNASESSIVDEIDNRFTSLKKKISYRDRVIAESREIISNRESTIAKNDATIASNKERINELEKENAKLKALAKEHIPTPTLTSKNSSVSPSKNPLGIAQTKSLREKSSKKSGGQMGRAGVTKEWCETPDSIEGLQAPTICPSCGKNIEDLPQFEGEHR
ncbi:MAG: hypothetical protein SNF93_02835, partial [Rikenellaceae bacterium]